MSSGSPPPEVLDDVAHLRPWLAARPGAVTALVHDENLAEAPVLAAVRRQLAWAGLAVTEIPVPPACDLPLLDELAARTPDASLYVAVGGGSVLDLAKLTALVRSEPAARPAVVSAARAGLVAVGSTPGPRAEVVAVPTTVGTGSESSNVAVVETATARRLVTAPRLRPDVAVLDPVATASLPRETFMAGALEALLRIVELAAGSPASPLEDALAETAATRLVAAAEAAASAFADGHHPTAATRREVARVSALSQSQWLLAGRAPHAFRSWYLANETAHAVGATKVASLARVVPAVWAATLRGDSRLGDADRLRRMWRAAAAGAGGGLPDDRPVVGILALCRRWGVVRAPLEHAFTGRIAQSITRAWGSGLPMLIGLRTEEVEQLLNECADPLREHPAPLLFDSPGGDADGNDPVSSHSLVPQNQPKGTA